MTKKEIEDRKRIEDRVAACDGRELNVLAWDYRYWEDCKCLLARIDKLEETLRFYADGKDDWGTKALEILEEE